MCSNHKLRDEVQPHYGGGGGVCSSIYTKGGIIAMGNSYLVLDNFEGLVAIFEGSRIKTNHTNDKYMVCISVFW